MDGLGGGGEGEESMWCEDGAELGSSPREFKATAEELVWRRKKTKESAFQMARGSLEWSIMHVRKTEN